MEEELKTTRATTHLEIWLDCPHCNSYQNRFDELREHFDTGEIRTEVCEVELVCEDCGLSFVVTGIDY